MKYDSYIDSGLLLNSERLFEYWEREFFDFASPEEADKKKAGILKIANEFRTHKNYYLWERAIAESILFHHHIYGVPYDEELTAEFSQVRPFGDIVPIRTLSELLKLDAAMAVFPLDGSKKDVSPQTIRLWVFRENDKNIIYYQHQDFRDGKFTGNSYELAKALVEKALVEKNINHKQRLALNWIITGAVENDNRVQKINIGNKCELNIKGRIPLLPYSNKNLKNGRTPWGNGEYPEYAVTVDDAWNHVTGNGAFNNPDLKLTERIDFLYMLIGESINPVLYTAFLLNPLKLILLHSDKTLEYADAVKKIMTMKKELNIQIQLIWIPSNNIDRIEKELRKLISTDKNSVRLLSITGGNRLMGIAAQLAAQTEKILMVYRDIDSEDNTFNILSFDKNPPECGLVKREPLPELKDIVDWEYLEGNVNRDKKVLDIEQISKKIWKF